MNTFARNRALAALAVAMVAITACGKDSTAPNNSGTTGALATITVTNATLAPSGTVQMVATGTDANGSAVSISPTWSVVAGGGAISATGLFTAGTTAGVYTNTVVATVGTITGRATITVTGTVGALASIKVTPAPIIMPQNGTQQFTAVGLDAAGNVVPITPVWAVVNGGGSISTGGIFASGTTPGVFGGTIRATSGTIQGFADITVTGPITAVTVTPGTASIAAGTVRQFTAVATDALGTIVASTTVGVASTATWTVVSGGGMISELGVFTAGAVGGAFGSTVRASIGGVTGSASVTVATSAGPVASISVAPSSTTLSAGGSRKFIATGFDASGTSITITPTWSVAGGGGTINALGFYTSGTVAGTFANSVVATSGSVSGAATVIIQPQSPPGQLALIQVLPVTGSVSVNGTVQFTATGFDAHDNVVAITPAWTVVNGGGTISSTGLFTAGGAAGTFTSTVRATSGNFFGTATVTVSSTAAAVRSP
jgi:hypothetical protein